MGKKKFIAVMLDLEYETFVVHVPSLSSVASINSIVSFSSIPFDIITPFCRSQIAGLIAKEAIINISTKYNDFADVFSPDLIYTKINEHTIKLVNGWQPPYRSIYSLEQVKLETIKAYIEINLTNKFIWLSKSPAGTLFFFDRNSNGLFRLCINYQGLNNLIIKNRYSLLLIGELLDRLGRAKWFIQLNRTSIHYWIGIWERDKWKTELQTWYGYFKYQVIPFELTNAPVSFQEWINKIFTKKINIFVIVYLNYIFIYTDNDGDGHIITVG